MFKNFKSIKAKLTVIICSLILLIVVVFVSATTFMMNNAAFKQADTTMRETLQLTGKLINTHLDNYINAAIQAGENIIFSDPNASIAEKEKSLQNEMNQFGFIGGNVTDINGKGLIDDVDVSDRDYFKKAISGEANYSNVLMSAASGEYVIIFAAPIYKDGDSNGDIVGAVYFNADADILPNITKNILIGESGAIYMLDKDGYVIAHNTITTDSRNNTLQKEKNNPEMKPLLEIETNMLDQKADSTTYTYGGIKKYAAYAPLGNEHGWSFNVNIEYDELTEDTNNAIITCCILAAIILALSIFAVIIVANSLAKPIRACARRLEKLADGDLASDVKQFKTKDEIGRLSNATYKITSNLSTIVSELSTGLNYMSNGDFTYQGKANELFVGGYKPLFDSYYKIASDLSETMNQITVASEQVNMGAEQISDSSQAMAQGATEQAASIEELAGTLSEVMDKINATASDAGNAKSVTDDTINALKLGSSQMQEVMSAMSDIDGKSKEINKIIKAIDDIAFQTNILSLNAAVEAARAGEAGKGFAVVADEVRNLAAKSAQSAKDTAALIEGTITAVKVGNETVIGTSEQLKKIMELSEKVSGYVDNISVASKEEANAVELINVGVEQISSVVQTNSATAEESAAASEELSGQAQMMQTLMEQFKTL